MAQRGQQALAGRAYAGKTVVVTYLSLEAFEKGEW